MRNLRLTSDMGLLDSRTSNRLRRCLMGMMGVAALLPMAGAMAGDSPHSVSGNVWMYSDYVFRGVSQTAGESAIQGGFDYAHTSGVYLSTWASNVTEAMYDEAALGTGNGAANLEWDFSAGYSGKIDHDLSYNVGLLKYHYPGATDFDTLEAWAGVAWKWFGVKAFCNLDDYFGAAGSNGTMYWDAAVNYELPAKMLVALHYGMTSAEGAAVDYNDWKIGVSREIGGFNVGLAYTDTDLSDTEQALIKGEDVKDGRLIVSIGRTF